MNVLHLSFFYPDEVEPVTTHAIKRLIDCADAFANNRRISLHMFVPPDGITVRAGNGHTVICDRIRTFPYGMRGFLKRCAASLRGVLEDPAAFDLVHAHMLAMEGDLALDLKERFGLRFVASVRATDFILFRYKPYMKRHYLKIIDAAERLILISHWMADGLARVFGADWTEERARKITFLYNIVDGEQIWKPDHNGRYAMPIVPHRSQLARKSVAATLRGIAALKRGGHPVRLDIFGTGDGIGRIARWIERYGLRDCVALKGHVPNEMMVRTLSDYKALFLCSKPETFGLVYIEALKAGIPIVHMAGTGIDGVFPRWPIGVAVKSRSSRSLADAFAQMDGRYAACKDAVRELQAAGALERFSSRSVQVQLQGLYSRAAGWSANADALVNTHGVAAGGIEHDLAVEGAA